MRNKIFYSGIILAFIFILAGCVAVTEPTHQTNNEEAVTYKQDMLTQAMEHAQQMQLAAVKAQDENAILRARNEELIDQLKQMQNGELPEEPEQEIELPQDASDLEYEYIKLQKDNEELRKLVKYERGLREELMIKINQDQKTINELISKLEE